MQEFRHKLQSIFLQHTIGTLQQGMKNLKSKHEDTK